MSLEIRMQPTEMHKLSPKIKVIGVGGAGGNAVNNMLASDLEGCEFLVCNTDAQALEGSLAESANRVQLGVTVTGGLGAGSKPEVGKAAAEESLDEVMRHLEGANMVFVTAGMGGGTGTGAAPVIARACREQGILTVGVVTKPFHFEGSHRMKSAEAGIEEMQDYVDTLIVIPNQNLFRVANEKTTFADAFQMADSVLQSGVRGVTDLMVRPGLVNLDFADIRTAMLEMGKAMMGTGEAEGDKRAIEAAEAAINNPLLDDISMKGAHGVIINVTGGYDMTLFEADEACNRIRDEVDPDANIIFGATFDQSLEGKMRVSIVATGIDKETEVNRRKGGGATSLNATGKNTLERAKPNTNGSQNETVAETAQAFAGQPAAQKPTFMPAQNIPGQHVHAIKSPPVSTTTGAPITAPASQTSTAPRSDEPEALDMFEQPEFSSTSQGAQNESPSNTAMRGTRYKNAFIPPKPVDVGGPAPHISSFHGAHIPQGGAASQQATQQTQPQQATTSSSLQLNPPRQPSPDKKRSPSLFERITGSVQEHLEGITHRSEHERTERKAPTAQYMSGEQDAAPTRPSPRLSQGSLNIESPSRAKSEGDDELDIPAFLRRQAN